MKAHSNFSWPGFDWVENQSLSKKPPSEEADLDQSQSKEGLDQFLADGTVESFSNKPSSDLDPQSEDDGRLPKPPQSEDELDRFRPDSMVKQLLSEKPQFFKDFDLNESDLIGALNLMMMSYGLVDADFKNPTNMVREVVNKFCVKVKEYIYSTPLTKSTSARTGSTESTIGSYYKCSTCGKEFGSYQALGGHRASHGKSLPLTENRTVKPVSREGVVHECTICRKQYPTGQALGGHMRCHYRGNLEKENRPNQQARRSTRTVTKSDGGRSSVTHRGFDLNVRASQEFCPTVEEEVNSKHSGKKSSMVMPNNVPLYSQVDVDSPWSCTLF